MSLFLLNKLGYLHPLKQRADGAYADGVPEQDLLQLSLVREGGSAHTFPNTTPLPPGPTKRLSGALSPTIPSGRDNVRAGVS